MSLGLIGYKVGMMQVFTTEGVAEPVTVLELGPCPVLQIKYPAADSERGGPVTKDGYTAVQLGFKDKKTADATIDGQYEAILNEAVNADGLKGTKIHVDTFQKKTFKGTDFTVHAWAPAAKVPRIGS